MSTFVPCSNQQPSWNPQDEPQGCCNSPWVPQFPHLVCCGTGLRQGSKALLCKGHQGPFLSAVQGDAKSRFMTWSAPLAVFQKTFSIQWSLQEETPNLLILLSLCLVFTCFILGLRTYTGKTSRWSQWICWMKTRFLLLTELVLIVSELEVLQYILQYV